VCNCLTWEMKSAYIILVGKPLGMRPLTRSRRWEDKSKMDRRKRVEGMGGGWNWLRIIWYRWY
jgi:hypothetical protein